MRAIVKKGIKVGSYEGTGLNYTPAMLSFQGRTIEVEPFKKYRLMDCYTATNRTYNPWVWHKSWLVFENGIDKLIRFSRDIDE